MKYIKQITISVLSSIVLLSTICFPVSAAATAKASIELSSTSVNDGDTVTATFKFDASEKIYVVKMNGTYDSSILKAESSDVGVVANSGIITATVGGHDTEISFKVKFKAIAAGNCTIDILNSEVDELVDHPTASTTLKVKSLSSDSSKYNNTNVSSTVSDNTLNTESKYSAESTSQGDNVLSVDESELNSLEEENKILSSDLKSARIVGGAFIVLSVLLIALLLSYVFISKKNSSK